MKKKFRIKNQESRIKVKKNKIISIIHDSPACSRLRRQPMAGRLFMIHSKGFTLVELLASVIVLVAIGSIIAGIITSSLRGTNKTNMIENIRQNGNYALAQMSKDISYAQTFDGTSTGFNFDNARNPKYLISCPSVSLNDITVKSGSSIVTKYICNNTPTLTANDNPLVGTSVSLVSCSFTCTMINNVPIIGISFKLGPKISNGLVENITPPITFETSVVMKNYRE